jgi:hypothetical protein
MTYVIKVEVSYESDNGSGEIFQKNHGKIWSNGEQGFTWEQFAPDGQDFVGVGHVLKAMCDGLNNPKAYIAGGLVAK